MTINVDEVIRVVATGSAPQAAVWQNVSHYKMVTGAGIADSLVLPAYWTNLITAFANVTAQISNTYSIDNCSFWKWNLATHQWDGIASYDPADIVGTGGTDAIPHGAAGVGRIITSALRRQGRTFLPGFIETASDLGLLDAGALAAFALYLADWNDSLSPAGGTLDWCTFNVEPLSVLYETASTVAGPIIANEIVGYQRRRKPGVGL